MQLYASYTPVVSLVLTPWQALRPIMMSLFNRVMLQQQGEGRASLGVAPAVDWRAFGVQPPGRESRDRSLVRAVGAGG
eukprot:10459869-Alexandrium_andersonii.AAC.1